MAKHQFEFEFTCYGNAIEASCGVVPLHSLDEYTVVFNDTDLNVFVFVFYKEANGNFLWFDMPAMQQRFAKQIVKKLRGVKA